MSFQQVAGPPLDGRALDSIKRTALQYDPQSWTFQTVPGLVAELRAAREVVEAVRQPTGPGWLDRVHAARAAYDRAVSEP